VTEEWFRSRDWSAEAQEDFEARLRRAREYNRPQYLAIKAGELLAHGGKAETEGARCLLMRVIETYPESLSVVSAHEQLGALDSREGNRRGAEAHYREALRLSPERHVWGDARLRLPELLIEDGNDETRREAGELLDALPPVALTFSSQRFRYAVARARLARNSGHRAEAQRYAEDALREAERVKPDFARHPTVGRVTADPTVLREMAELAGE
jgi:tetratricopeptide (TPR) repeat protein